LHSSGFGDFSYIYDVHDVVKMGELWPTFFTLDSHAAERRRRRHLIDAAAAEKKIDRCAAAAGQNHPARRRRKNDVGAGLYNTLIHIL